MEIIKLNGSNEILPQLFNAPALKSQMQLPGSDKTITCHLIGFVPDKKDLQNIKAGAPIILQIYGDNVNPLMLYTCNSNGEPNLKQQNQQS